MDAVICKVDRRCIMNNYIIGIDGGGTKTLGVLFTLEGHQVKRVEKGFSNFRVNKQIAEQNILAVLDELVNGIDVSTVHFIQIGVAGVPEKEVKDELVNRIQQLYQTPASMVTDAEIALYSIRKNTDDCVIMVLGGTGSAIMVKNKDQDMIIGGFGHLLGDEGSGYHLAITALKEIIQEYEQNKPISELSKAILNEINATDYMQIKDFVYNSSKQEIASLSSFIASFAEHKNPDAIRLFQEEGKHLARQTMTAFHKLNTCRKVTIGFRGNFLLHAPYVKETMINELDDNKLDYSIDVHPLEPVIGAYYLGLQQLRMR